MPLVRAPVPAQPAHALEILRRESAAVKPPGEAVSHEPTELEGEWAMKSCLQNGAPMQKAVLQKMRRIFAGGSTTLFLGNQVVAKSRFILNGRELDYPDLGQAGIFEFSAKGLKTSMAARGGTRPHDFATESGQHCTVTEWKRNP